ncbi:DUF2726 domain-containing protein [Pontiella agarivorans]|uniref:DUF2726 domain-containing protein n=1 Tax=Pontiella agarivorans TaxID=3038953 RepID=A0ABU5MXV6_9BACT|nr:DUF2726 domain-containing protein [Pontiella agarivorans]MDZ8118921.1 DUF2726 domain-containing protein [Pontiella agarivorans]
MIKIYLLGAALLTLPAMRADAESGDTYAESVSKHGKPVGKMANEKQTVYVFQANGFLVREVYNHNDICIQSDFQPSTVTKEVPASEPKPPPAPETVPAPEPMPVETKKSCSPLWFLLLLPLPALLGGIVFWLKRHPQHPIAESAPNALELQKGQEDTTLRLSRNEMSFLKTLHEAVAGQFMITFHIALDRIIDFDAPNVVPYVPELKTLTPLYADFVLHHPHDAAVSCVVLLKDSKTQNEKRNRRIQFQQIVLEEQGIQVLVVNQNYEYDVRKIQDQLAFLRKTACRSVA